MSKGLEIHLRDEHPKSMGERIAKRLRPSNDSMIADEMKQVGSGPTRTITTIHHPGNNRVHKPQRESGRLQVMPKHRILTDHSDYYSSSPGAKLDAYLKQKEIDRVMRDVIQDQRRNPTFQSQSMFPERTTPEPSKGTGWVDPPKLERPPGIDIIDRMLDAQDIRDRKKRMEEG